MQLQQVFNNCSSLIVYKDNSSHEFFKGEEQYVLIMNTWNEIVCDAYEMPAYGVSIDSLTREEMKSGQWLEFVFDGKCQYNEMPFEKLLVKVEEEYSGFNVIRYLSEGGYFGRCFYMQLNDKNMSSISNEIKNIQI